MNESDVFAADIEVILGDSAGADSLSVKDSGSAEVSFIDSDGNISANGSVTFSSLVSCTSIQTSAGGVLSCSSPSLTTLSDVNSATALPGRLLIANGSEWDSVGMTGDCSLSANGTITCLSIAASLTGLSDVNSSTATSGNILVANGNEWDSVSVSGDISIVSTGAVDIQANTVGTNELTMINSATATPGNLLIANGTEFDSVAMSNHCTISSTGAITCTGGGAVANLIDLGDVSSSTATAGNLLVANGTDFGSVSMTGLINLNGTGTVVMPTTTQAGNYTATVNDNVIFANANAGTITISMPATVTNGQVFIIKRIDSNLANNVVVSGNGANIDDAATKNLSAFSAYMIIGDGTQWWII